jgi:hypothetical protein
MLFKNCNFTFCVVWVQHHASPLKEKTRLRPVKNSVPREIFLPKGEKVQSEWSKIRKFFSSLHITQLFKAKSLVPVQMGNVLKVLVGRLVNKAT